MKEDTDSRCQDQPWDRVFESA